MHVYGVAVRSDARMTLDTFISFAGAPITKENFTADMYFSASQAAIWCALGDAQIAANNNFGVSYVSSTSLGYDPVAVPVCDPLFVAIQRRTS